MKLKKLSDFHRGWIVGNFDPALVKTADIEIGILTHKKGEHWPKHYHKLAVEWNVLISGKMEINGWPINSGDIFIIERNEVSEPTFLEDCTILVFKIPSVPGDKYEV